MQGNDKTMKGHFTILSRGIHWLMAIMIVSMLFIGIAMVTSLADYHRLVSIHRPLGILILLLAVIRLINRFVALAPSLPREMPGWQKLIAHASHWVLYGLMFAMPLVGWAMLSAAGYPIVLWGPVQLPPIFPHDIAAYAVLRSAHTVLAIVLFFVVIAHLGAALVHALIFRDGVFQSMAGGKLPPTD